MTPSNPSTTDGAYNENGKCVDTSQPGATQPLDRIFDFAQLFEIHSVLQALCGKTIDHCRTSAVTTAQQRSEFEELSEWLRRFETNLHEARNHIDTLGVALDRIKIVALNTGLEGARLGDLAGKALIAVSDELRSMTARGLEILSEQATTIEQMETDRQRLLALGERGEVKLADLESRLRDALAAQQTSQTELGRLASALQQSTGLDVEAAARLSRISEQARDLVKLLDALSATRHHELARAALVPALGPIVAWLAKDVDSSP
ncbi:MAG TPA: hypothetical protein VIV60_30820 [Polyangiaceae bacterium]